MTDETTQADAHQPSPEDTVQAQAKQIEALGAQVQKLQQEAHEAGIHSAALTRRLGKANAELVAFEGQVYQYEQIMQSLQQRQH